MERVEPFFGRFFEWMACTVKNAPDIILSLFENATGQFHGHGDILPDGIAGHGVKQTQERIEQQQ